MRKSRIFGMILIIALLLGALAQAETRALTGDEIRGLAEQARALAEKSPVLNDPAAEEAASEDGFAFQFDFGVIYGDQPAWQAETGINAFLIMDEEVAGPRGLAIDWEVNRVMSAIPCDNPEMNGSYEEAVLYLEGEAEGLFRYGLVERDGQRIAAMEYGEVNVAQGAKISLTLQISGDGVSGMRAEGFQETFDAAALRDLYGELEALTHHYEYARVPRSQNGLELAPFSEADLDFPSLSFRTAEPEIFGSNVDTLMMDNEDGTWLRRVDGDGFEAVFSCDSEGKNATLKSYAILSPELEGPRCVRLGDLFHEDFTRFRSGEGDLDEAGLVEVLYGQVGKAPYGVAEYGDGTEMTLRYVTETLGGPDVELILRYQDTVLTEIILHTVDEE